MPNLYLSEDFYVAWDRRDSFASGQIFHVERFPQGGRTDSQIARFYLTQPGVTGDSIPHTRVDCFVQEHRASPSPEWLGKALADALSGSGLLPDPFWISWHSSQEISGTGTNGDGEFD